MGVTTGGMLTTEQGLEDGNSDPKFYRYHGTGSVAEFVADAFKCHGPAITISTACSSGAAAIAAALEMLRSGQAERVLAGGADALCRLTCFGFHALQLVDPTGAHPLDVHRRGMTVAEGAGVLLLTASEQVPENAIACVLGAGLGCDAYHASSPHPEGEGAFRAMEAAIADANINAHEIDYINLHGTGTPDNDLSEAKAIVRLFPHEKPVMSSIKGAFGHPLAAAGAVEAVVCALAISEGMIPANAGCNKPDPELGLLPVLKPVEGESVKTVLSNSFGFGGNNTALVIAANEKYPPEQAVSESVFFEILGSSCLTGAGDTDQTLGCLLLGEPCAGRVPDKIVSRGLPPRVIRRLKRFPRMALSMAEAVVAQGEASDSPDAVFLGTGWGALSETHDFLEQLFESHGAYASPIDFVGSVHNAAAGQVAIRFGIKGPNITATGGDYSFEQALMLSGLLSKDSKGALLVMAADEYHDRLSPLFDPSVRLAEKASDGGGCLLLRRTDAPKGIGVKAAFYEKSHASAIAHLVKRLSEKAGIAKGYGAVLAGIPARFRDQGQQQLTDFIRQSGFSGPVIDYRGFVGEFASASAVATVLAARFVKRRKIPGGVWGTADVDLKGKGILVLGLGGYITAVCVNGQEVL